MSEELEEMTKENQEESVLLKEYKKLQENTVSKEKYEADIKALKEKNDLYLKAITEGEKVDVSSEEDSGSVTDTIAKLSNFRGTNLDYWKETTKAIDQTIKALGNEAITKTIGADGLEELIEVIGGLTRGGKELIKRRAIEYKRKGRSKEEFMHIFDNLSYLSIWKLETTKSELLRYMNKAWHEVDE